MNNQKSVTVKKMCIMAMMCAISVVLTAFIHFPIFPAAPFLEYDPADIPIFIGTFLYGPASGLIITAVTAIIQGVTVSAGSGIIGIVMHIVATGAFVIVFGLISYKRTGTKRRIIGLVCGSLTMALVMAAMNLIFTPLFMGAPMEMVLAMLLPVIIPFNLIKAGANAVIAFILFRLLPLHRIK